MSVFASGFSCLPAFCISSSLRAIFTEQGEKTMRRVAILVLAVLFLLYLFVDWGIAGPFGLSMGMKPAEVGGKLEKLEGLGKYRTTEVPNPHSFFDVYYLRFGPKTGLCWVMAESKPVATSVSGTELRSEFDQMEERLTAQYRKGKRYDLLRDGSMLNQPKDFMPGLQKQDRSLTAIWSVKDGAVMSDHLQEVWIQACALSDEKGCIRIWYQFENFEQCGKELNAAEDYTL
jgi:hypothetical protein